MGVAVAEEESPSLTGVTIIVVVFSSRSANARSAGSMASSLVRGDGCFSILLPPLFGDCVRRDGPFASGAIKKSVSFSSP